VNGKWRKTPNAKYVRLGGACLLQITAYLLGIAAFVAGLIGVATITDAPFVFIGSGLLATATSVTLISWNSAHVLRRNSKWRYAFVQGIAATGVVYFIAALFLFRPIIPESHQYTLTVPDGVEFWDLLTGSTIAVRKIASQVSTKSKPIIYLHGGPGAYSVSWEPTVEAMQKLSAKGHNIYLYDQVGGGLSERLEYISEYSLDRHVDDLEAMRQKIGAEKIILMGSSFGGTLAANYMARYPNHVSKAVFFSVGPIYLPDWSNKSDGSLDDKMTPDQKTAFDRTVERPRLLAAIILAEVNPQAAVKFASERELGSFFDLVANTHYLPLITCKPQTGSATSVGYGFWSNRMTGKTLSSRSNDPKPSLRLNSTPVLILRGECDYKSEAVSLQYASTFRNAIYTPVAGAGHLIYNEKQEEFVNLVDDFLKSRDDM